MSSSIVDQLKILYWILYQFLDDYSTIATSFKIITLLSMVHNAVDLQKICTSVFSFVHDLQPDLSTFSDTLSIVNNS